VRRGSQRRAPVPTEPHVSRARAAGRARRARQHATGLRKSSRTVSCQSSACFCLQISVFLLLNPWLSQNKCSDKKNENKEVAVNEVQPASAARDAIQYSMLVSKLEHFQASHSMDFPLSSKYRTIYDMITFLQGSLCTIHFAEPAAVVSSFMTPGHFFSTST